MLRAAIIERPTSPLSTIQAYLPGNYEAVAQNDGSILVYGQDNAGWTLDGYVIPRLASGLHFAREVDLDPIVQAVDHAAMELGHDAQ
jgi:hypothetical protein